MTSETPYPDFEAAYASAEPRCCAPKDRCEVLYREAHRTRRLPGDLAELGVWRGGTACVMALAAPDKDLWLFDTFNGMPEPAEIDQHERGDFKNTSAQEVLGWLAAETGSLHRYHLKPGVFPATTADVDSQCFACVHLDADLYESTRAGLEYFWPRLSDRGSIVFDDFGWPRCPGVAGAIAGFFGGAIAELAREVHLAEDKRNRYVYRWVTGEVLSHTARLYVSALDQCVIVKDRKGRLRT